MLGIFITSGGVSEQFTVIIYVPFLTMKEKSLDILLKKENNFKKAIFFIFYEGKVLILNLASTKNYSSLLTFNKLVFHSSQGRIIVVLTAQ